MHDLYHAPALVLTALSLPTFGYLYLRFRDARTLLWLLGFFFDLIAMVLVDTANWWHFPVHAQPWLTAASGMQANPFGTFTSQLGAANGSSNDVAQLLQGDAIV